MKLKDFLKTTVFDFERYEVAVGIAERVSAIFHARKPLCDAFGDYEVYTVTNSDTNEPNAIQFVLESEGNRELREYVDKKRKESYEAEFKRGLDSLKKAFYGTDVYEYLDEYGKYLFNRGGRIYLKKDGYVNMRSIRSFWRWIHRTHPFFSDKD